MIISLPSQCFNFSFRYFIFDFVNCLTLVIFCVLFCHDKKQILFRFSGAVLRPASTIWQYESTYWIASCNVKNSNFDGKLKHIIKLRNLPHIFNGCGECQICHIESMAKSFQNVKLKQVLSQREYSGRLGHDNGSTNSQN